MMRKNKVVVLSLFILWICCICKLSAADVEPVKWNAANDHNRWTECMLFGNESYTYAKPEEIRLRVEQLEDALLICIDQFNGYYEDKLAKLSFIQGVPDDISAINFTAGNLKEETSHRAYTHRGWNHSYNDQKSHPDIRKQILVSVVEHVFHFKRYYSSEKADKACDAMGCLLYNFHIIEDRYHSKVYYGAASTLLLADASQQTETVIHDIQNSVRVLFPNVDKTNELIVGLQRISGEIVAKRRVDPTNDGLLMIDRTYAVDLKNLLAQHLPELLQNEPWFREAFPSNWNSN